MSKANYAKILEAMSSGEWELNGEAIKIARTGRILDGQHRLMVAAENDFTFQTLVVYGLEDDVQDTMDTGKARSVADVLAIAGYANSVSLASIVTGIIRKERYGLRAAVYDGSSSYQVTARQTLNRVEQEPSLTELPNLAYQMRKSGLNGKLSGILYYTFSDIDQEDADYFFTKLETGESLERNDPILVLRELLLNLKSSVKGQVKTGYVAAVTIKAWNKFRSGEQISQLKFRPGGANPEHFPEPF